MTWSRSADAGVRRVHARPASLCAGVLAGALLGSIACSTAKTADALAVKLNRDGAGAVLAIYDRGCSEEDYAECVVADLGCVVPGDLRATVLGLTPRQAGDWLAKDAGKGTLTIGRDRIPVAASKLEFSDLSGNWDVSLAAPGDASGIWRRLATAAPMSVSIADRTVALPQGGAAAGAFRELLKVCAPGAGKS